MGKKVFISYSWGNKEHETWIVNLGKRLMTDTVDVVLDKWSLKDGHDIHGFMEEMVKSEDIFRVLIICDKNYKDKADARKGGVGTETQIITPEIYTNQKQEKFIPIILEKDSEGNHYMPIYLASRKHIDFSNEESFEDSYEELLRNIMEAPAIPKPKLGTVVPSYITESKVNTSEVNSAYRSLVSQIQKHPNRINTCAANYINTFLEKLWDFEYKGRTNDIIEFGDDLYENLLSYKELKDEFVLFIQTVTQCDLGLDVDELIMLFEQKASYLKPKLGSGISGREFDNYRIIFHELFLYTIAACLKNKNYVLIGNLLYSVYHVNQEYIYNGKPRRFTYLYNYHENMYNYILNKYRHRTGFGYYIINNLNANMAKADIVLADVLCYVIVKLHNLEKGWFPWTYIYREPQIDKLDFFNRLDSKRYFEKVKGIFDVNSKEDLIELINRFKENHKDSDKYRYYDGIPEYIPFPHELIDVNNIATER